MARHEQQQAVNLFRHVEPGGDTASPACAAAIEPMTGLCIGMPCQTPSMPDVWEPTDDTGQPLRNQALVDAMQAVSVQDTPERRALLFQLLLDSTLIVVTANRPAVTGTKTVQAGERLNLLTLQNVDGPVLPVFTSAAALRSWRPAGTSVAALPARVLLEMASTAGTATIAIDPGSLTHGYLTRREIETLAKGRLPLGAAGDLLQQETRIQIGIPQEPLGPVVLDALRDALIAEPAALQAWYFLLQQGQSQPELCVAIQLTPGTTGEQERAAMRAIIDRAGSRSADGRGLTFMTVGGDLRASLESGGGRRFFRRA